MSSSPMSLFEAVQLAVKEGELNVVRFLVKHNPCLVEMKAKKGRTLLGIAARSNQLELVKYLVDEVKCNIDCLDETEKSPIMIAAKYGYLDIVKFLNEKGANLAPSGLEALDVATIAAEKNQVDILRYLNETHPNFLRDSSALNSACWNDDCLDAVKFLVQDAKCDPYSDWALNDAAQCGNQGIVKFLVDTYPDIVEKCCSSNPFEAELVRLTLDGASQEELDEMKEKRNAYEEKHRLEQQENAVEAK